MFFVCLFFCTDFHGTNNQDLTIIKNLENLEDFKMCFPDLEDVFTYNNS